VGNGQLAGEVCEKQKVRSLGLEIEVAVKFVNC
jgi:hypothetical protein